MTDASRAVLLACAIAGPALWLSRAVVDRAGTGDGFRVAFLPSAPELAGLTVAIGLLLLLAGAALRARITRRDRHARIDSRVLIPVGLLAVVALPFLPLLANRLPVVDVLAGPGRWWVWGIAVGLVAWLVGGDMASRIDTGKTSPDGAHAGRRWNGWAIAGISLVLFAGAAWRLAPSALYPRGDEPHYLIIAQSLLTDGDLRIDNNHARDDYRDYYEADLAPHSSAPGRDEAVYSIHPIGLPALVAPAFALGGYRAASLTVVTCAVLAALLLWGWARAVTGSAAAAVAGWLAITGSASFLLHSFAIYPEVPAALCVLVVIGWRWRQPDSTASALVRGVALAVLPWLSTKYAPMSAGLLVLLLTRPESTRHRRLLATLPWTFSVALWLGWFWVLWGAASPTAPYGGSHQMSVAHLLTGLPGLLFDQEYGIVTYAPALALAFPGWWDLWRTGHRRLVVETAGPFVLLALTVGAYVMFWGGSSAPGRQIVAAMPLLGVPLAWLYWRTRDRPVQRAAIVVLVLLGTMVSATMVFAGDGLLIANGSDGTAALLTHLTPSGELVRLLPSLVRARTEPLSAAIVVTTWLTTAGLAWWLAGRVHASHGGTAALKVGLIGLVALLAGAFVVPIVAPGLPARTPVEARGVVAALMQYDATARPWAIDYRPFRLAAPETLLPEFVLTGTPGLRTAPQPLRVLKNMRLALPPGEYRVVLQPKAGEVLSGDVGLQVGRVGHPRDTWTLEAAHGSWAQTFTLDLETSFVGFRASPAFDDTLAQVTVTPLAVLDAARRMPRPPVLGAARFSGLPFYFHDELAYAEEKGFWVRGRAALRATVGLTPGLEPPGVRLQVHSGQATTEVRLSTPAWSGVVGLAPGELQQVLVPALPTQRLLALTIAPAHGFIPAEHGGAPDDHRFLGCWVEVLPR